MRPVPARPGGAVLGEGAVRGAATTGARWRAPRRCAPSSRQRPRPAGSPARACLRAARYADGRICHRPFPHASLVSVHYRNPVFGAFFTGPKSGARGQKHPTVAAEAGGRPAVGLWRRCRSYRVVVGGRVGLSHLVVGGLAIALVSQVSRLRWRRRRKRQTRRRPSSALPLSCQKPCRLGCHSSAFWPVPASGQGRTGGHAAWQREASAAIGAVAGFLRAVSWSVRGSVRGRR
jgi:hypothetical protein